MCFVRKMENGRMVLTTDLEDVASCDFIIENVTEDWDVKRPVYEKLDRVDRKSVV